MTRDEAKKIIMLLSATYPNFKPLDLTSTVDAWAMLLGDCDYNQAAEALADYIKSDTSGFAPSIGQLLDRMHTIKYKKRAKKIETQFIHACGNTINVNSPLGIAEVEM